MRKNKAGFEAKKLQVYEIGSPKPTLAGSSTKTYPLDNSTHQMMMYTGPNQDPIDVNLFATRTTDDGSHALPLKQRVLSKGGHIRTKLRDQKGDSRND